MVRGSEERGAADTASGDVGVPRKGEAHGIPGGRSSSPTQVTGNTRVGDKAIGIQSSP